MRAVAVTREEEASEVVVGLGEEVRRVVVGLGEEVEKVVRVEEMEMAEGEG